MFDPSVWGWPQWTVMVLLALTFASGAALHGKKRENESFNGFVSLFRFALWMFLLIFGGFFG